MQAFFVYKYELTKTHKMLQSDKRKIIKPYMLWKKKYINLCFI